MKNEILQQNVLKIIHFFNKIKSNEQTVHKKSTTLFSEDEVYFNQIQQYNNIPRKYKWNNVSPNNVYQPDTFEPLMISEQTRQTQQPLADKNSKTTSIDRKNTENPANLFIKL